MLEVAAAGDLSKLIVAAREIEESFLILMQPSALDLFLSFTQSPLSLSLSLSLYLSQ
jgi:hypothetical protein